MKNKTILSFLTAILLAALFFSCAVEPTAGAGDKGTNNPPTQPSGPDQIEVTIKIANDMKNKYFSGARPLNGNLKFYNYNDEYQRYNLRSNQYIMSDDESIVIDKSTYDTIRNAKNVVKIFFPLNTGLFATNKNTPNIDTTKAGTKKVTIIIDTTSIQSDL